MIARAPRGAAKGSNTRRAIVAKVIPLLVNAKGEVDYREIIRETKLNTRAVRAGIHDMKRLGEWPTGVKLIYRKCGRKPLPPCDLCGGVGGKHEGDVWDIEGLICEECQSDLARERNGNIRQAERVRSAARSEQYRAASVAREAKHEEYDPIYRKRQQREFARAMKTMRVAHEADDAPTYLAKVQAREAKTQAIRAELCRRWFAEWQAIRETHSVCLIA